MGLGEHEPRLALERSVPRPLVVFEELEGGPGRADRVVRTEGLERLPGELQSVFDRFLGNVPLRKMMDELRENPIQPARVALFNQLRVFSME